MAENGVKWIFTDAGLYDIIKKSFAFRGNAQFYSHNRAVAVQIRQYICTAMI